MSGHEIFEAIEAGDTQSVRRLASRDPAIGKAVGADGVSAVLQALYREREDLVEPLRPPTNQLDVFEAAALGEPDRVRQLLDGDPDLVSAFSPDGFTPLHLAAFFGRGVVVDLLLDRGAPLEVFARSSFAPVTPLQSAASAGHVQVARRLLDAGANARAESERGGFTPLHSAAQNGDVELARLLLERGADAAAASDDGRTPLDLAPDDAELRALLA